mmetsp:Transcript_13962/g.27454  ORF Transcript_13962/g.27454 Transcript_13962/m.27454 type:complete len:80 (+) Transcript_13962:2102-2341(+)
MKRIHVNGQKNRSPLPRTTSAALRFLWNVRPITAEQWKKLPWRSKALEQEPEVVLQSQDFLGSRVQVLQALQIHLENQG